MRVVAGFGLVFDMCCRNGDTTLSLFWCLVDSSIFEKVCESLLGLSLRDGGCECSLSVIDVANRTLYG